MEDHFTVKVLLSNRREYTKMDIFWNQTLQILVKFQVQGYIQTSIDSQGWLSAAKHCGKLPWKPLYFPQECRHVHVAMNILGQVDQSWRN
jgi:hypothetical protein